MRLSRWACAGAVAAVVAAGALAPRAAAQGMDPDQERARQLVVRIRRSMREIDSLLLTGSQPEKVEKELAANQKRIEELLKETESKSQSVIQNIDELIKLTKYQQQKDKQPSGGGGSDEDSQGGPQKQPQRNKSEDPQELQKQQKPEGEQPQDAQKKPEPGKEEPKHGGPDKKPPENSPANQPPPKSPTGEFERADTAGRWGMLPPKEAEDLQRRDAEEFPQRYRRWMELYFQRVNKLPARDR
jgi:hypothetical protein